MANVQLNFKNPVWDSLSSTSGSDFDSDSSAFDFFSSTSSLFSSSLFSDSNSCSFSSDEESTLTETKKEPIFPNPQNKNILTKPAKDINNTSNDSIKHNENKNKLAMKIILDKTDSSKSVSHFIHEKNIEIKLPETKDVSQLSKNKDNFCDICGEIFNTQALLDVHKLSHLISETYTCEVCQHVSKNREDYALHFKVHDQSMSISGDSTSRKRNPTISYPCEICSKVFRFSSSLKRHLENHSTAYTCNICNTTFPTELLCHQHKLKHAKNKSHVCDVCGKLFQRPHQLTIHMQVHTQNDKKFRCEECNTMYSYKTSLSRHVLKYHSHNTKKFQCNVCGELFKTKKMLNGHVILHTAKKLIQCSDCTQTFKYRSSYHRHRVIHQGTRPFRCTNCGQLFQTESLLKIHKVQHIVNDEFVCMKCDKSFAFQLFLDQHMLIHEDILKDNNLGDESN